MKNTVITLIIPAKLVSCNLNGILNSICLLRPFVVTALAVLLLSGCNPISADHKTWTPKLIVQMGHSQRITSVAYSPNGKLIASASDDGTIKIWETESQKELRTLEAPSGYIAFSPDSKKFVSVGEGITLWAVESGKVLSTIDKAADVVVFSPDSKTIASIGDETISLFDVTTGKAIGNLPGHSAAFSADGKTVVAVAPRNIIKVWDLATRTELRSHPTDESVWKSCFAVSPDGRTLASGGERISLWDVSSGKKLHELPLHSSAPTQVSFSSDGKTLLVMYDDEIATWDVESVKRLQTIKPDSVPSFVFATFSPDNKTIAYVDHEVVTVRLWDVQSGKQRRTLSLNYPYSSIAFSPDGQNLAIANDTDLYFSLWNVNTGEQEILSGLVPINSLAFSPDGKVLASSCGNVDEKVDGRTVTLWNLQTGRPMCEMSGLESPSKVVFSPDGRIVAAACDGGIFLWNATSGKKLTNITAVSEQLAPPPNGWIPSMAFSPDSKTLFALYADDEQNARLRQLDAASGKVLRVYNGIFNFDSPFALSPDGKIFAAQDEAKGIGVWDVQSGKNLRFLESNAEWQPVLAFSHDGKKLATSDGLWDVETGERLKTFSDASTITFSPDGTSLGVASDDGTVRVLDLPSGEEVRKFPGAAIAFSSDGNTVAVGGADNSVKLWNVTSGAEIAMLCAFGSAGSTADSDETVSYDPSWAVVTHDGRFDASPGGMEMMHYNVGNEVVELSRFRDYFLEPSLLPKLLGYSKEPLYKIPSFDDIQLAPHVSHRFDKQSGKLILELTNRGGGFGRVQIKVNDAIFDPGPEFNSTVKNADGKDKIVLPTIDILQAANVTPGTIPDISVVAYPKDERLVSRTLSIDNSSREPMKPSTRPELHAIIIGVSEYAKDSLNLRFSSKDALDFERTIKLAGERHFGKGKVHIKLMTSGSSSDDLPTRENIEKAFIEKRKSKPDDILLVYFAGHGVSVPVEAANGGQTHLYCYLTSDARMTDLSNRDVREQTSITSDDLRNWMNANVMPAKKKVLILDTCAAGNFDGGKLSLTRNTTGDQEKAVFDLKDKIGFHVLMGCTENAVSYEAGEYGQGLLTYSLLEGMTGPALLSDAGDSKRVFVNELFDYATKRVPKLATGIGGIQEPRFLTPENSTNFWIGELGPGEFRQIPLASRKPRILKPLLINQDDQVDDSLMVALRKKLESEYSTVARGAANQSSFIFIPADECPGAYSLRGTYHVKGDEVSVDVTLSRDRKKVGNTIKKTLRGTQDEIVDQLIAEILGQIK